MFIPVREIIKRHGFLPILSFTYETVSTEKMAVSALMFRAVTTIEKAEEFKGYPYQSEIENSKAPLAVTFSLIFPSNKELEKFLKLFQKY